MSKIDIETEKKKQQLRKDLEEYNKLEREEEFRESIETIGNNILSAVASITEVSASALEALVEKTKEENKRNSESDADRVKRQLELRKKQQELKEIEKAEKKKIRKEKREINNVGIITFFVLLLIFSVDFIPSLAIALLVRFGVKKMKEKNQPLPWEKNKNKSLINSKGEKPKEVNKFIKIMKAADKELDDIYYTAKNAEDDEIRDLSTKLYERGLAILGHLRSHPEKLNKSTRFLSYYLETASKICRKYTEFSSQSLKTEDIDGVLESTKRAMILLEKAFDNEFLKLVEDDIIDIETDVKVLENSMKWDNYID